MARYYQGASWGDLGTGLVADDELLFEALKVENVQFDRLALTRIRIAFFEKGNTPLIDLFWCLLLGYFGVLLFVSVLK